MACCQTCILEGKKSLKVDQKAKNKTRVQDHRSARSARKQRSIKAAGRCSLPEGPGKINLHLSDSESTPILPSITDVILCGRVTVRQAIRSDQRESSVRLVVSGLLKPKLKKQPATKIQHVRVKSPRRPESVGGHSRRRMI